MEDCGLGLHNWIAKMVGPATCEKCGKTYTNEDYNYDKEKEK